MKPVCVICQLISMSSKYFKKCPTTSNFYSAVWISRANFIVPEKTKLALICPPSSHKTLIGWCIFLLKSVKWKTAKWMLSILRSTTRLEFSASEASQVEAASAGGWVKNKRKRLMLSEDRGVLHIYHGLSTSCLVKHLNFVKIRGVLHTYHGLSISC